MKRTLTHDEKNALANAAYQAIKHPFVQEVCEEFALNMHFDLTGLPAYGMKKVCQYAAIVARCMALDIDPQAMMMDDEEAAETMATMAKAFTDAGKPVIVIGE